MAPEHMVGNPVVHLRVYDFASIQGESWEYREKARIERDRKREICIYIYTHIEMFKNINFYIYISNILT